MPAPSSSTTVWLPMKPAPPVARTRGLSSLTMGGSASGTPALVVVTVTAVPSGCVTTVVVVIPTSCDILSGCSLCLPFSAWLSQLRSSTPACPSSPSLSLARALSLSLCGVVWGVVWCVCQQQAVLCYGVWGRAQEHVERAVSECPGGVDGPAVQEPRGRGAIT